MSKRLLITPALSHIQQGVGFQERGRDDITFFCTQIFLQAEGNWQVNNSQGGTSTPLNPAPQLFPLWDADRDILEWDLLFSYPSPGARLLFSPPPQFSAMLLEEGLDERVWKEVVAGLPSSSSQDDIMPAVVSELLVCCWAAAWGEANPRLAQG